MQNLLTKQGFHGILFTEKERGISMKKTSLRPIATALVLICALLVAAGTVWLGTQEMSVEQVYNVAISTLVIVISALCVAALFLIGWKKRK